MRPLLTSAVLFLMTSTLASANPVEICLFEEEDWSATFAACNEALAASTDPFEQGRFVLHRGIAHDYLGDLEAARLDYILASNYRPDWFRGYANAASISEELGDTEAQLRWAQAAIDAEPDDPRAYLEMLGVLINDGVDESCLPLSEQIITLLQPPVDWAFAAEPDPYLMGNLGYCLSRNDQPELAMQALLAADYMEMEEAWLFGEISYVAYAFLEQYERAIEYSLLAMAADEPTMYDVDTVINSHIYLDDVDAALAAATQYSDLLDAQVEDWGTRNIVGWRLFLADRLDEASTVMEAWVVWAKTEMAEGRPTEGYIWDTVGHIRAGLGDTVGARAAFMLAYDNQPDMDWAREFYATELTQAGFDIGEGDAGIIAALEACAAAGPACRLIPDDEDPALQ